jgi:hypothetical protein
VELEEYSFIITSEYVLHHVCKYVYHFAGLKQTYYARDEVLKWPPRDTAVGRVGFVSDPQSGIKLCKHGVNHTQMLS